MLPEYNEGLTEKLTHTKMTSKISTTIAAINNSITKNETNKNFHLHYLMTCRIDISFLSPRVQFTEDQIKELKNFFAIETVDYIPKHGTPAFPQHLEEHHQATTSVASQQQAGEEGQVAKIDKVPADQQVGISVTSQEQGGVEGVQVLKKPNIAPQDLKEHHQAGESGHQATTSAASQLQVDDESGLVTKIEDVPAVQLDSIALIMPKVEGLLKNLNLNQQFLFMVNFGAFMQKQADNFEIDSTLLD